MTGMKDPWIDESAGSLGARIVMRKPFDAKELLKNVEEYLPKRQNEAHHNRSNRVHKAKAS